MGPDAKSYVGKTLLSEPIPRYSERATRTEGTGKDLRRRRLTQTFSVVVDLSYNVKSMPARGKDAEVLRSRLTLGGGYSTMFAARQMGMDCVYLGAIGNGPLAELVRRRMHEDGILDASDASQSQYLDQGACTVVVEPDGQRTFFKHNGVEVLGFPSQTRFDYLALTNEDFVVSSGYTFTLTPNIDDAVATWTTTGKLATTLFDPSPVHYRISSERMEKILRSTTWFTGSATEIREITGISDLESAAQEVAKFGPNVIVRTGRDGAILLDAATMTLTYLPTAEVSTIDTTAAGETHIGVMVATLSAGIEPPHAVAIANVAAALSTREDGASTCPNRSELSSFLRENSSFHHLAPMVAS